jgi:hypothetical protein
MLWSKPRPNGTPGSHLVSNYVFLRKERTSLTPAFRFLRWSFAGFKNIPPKAALFQEFQQVHNPRLDVQHSCLGLLEIMQPEESAPRQASAVCRSDCARRAARQVFVRATECSARRIVYLRSRRSSASSGARRALTLPEKAEVGPRCFELRGRHRSHGGRSSGAPCGMRHPSPADRAIRNNPAPTTRAPIARATRSPAGARRSTVMAAVTTAIARRSMTPMTRRIAVRPAQQ